MKQGARLTLARRSRFEFREVESLVNIAREIDQIGAAAEAFNETVASRA